MLRLTMGIRDLIGVMDSVLSVRTTTQKVVTFGARQVDNTRHSSLVVVLTSLVLFHHQVHFR